MVDFKKISQEIRTDVEKIMSQDGDAKKIDSKREMNQIGNLLAGATGSNEKEYYNELMSNYYSANTPAVEVSPSLKKSLIGLAKFDKGSDFTKIDSEVEARNIVSLLNDSRFNDSEKEFLHGLLKHNGFAYLLPDANKPQEAAPKTEQEATKAKDEPTPPMDEPTPPMVKKADVKPEPAPVIKNETPEGVPNEIKPKEPQKTHSNADKKSVNNNHNNQEQTVIININTKDEIAGKAAPEPALDEPLPEDKIGWEPYPEPEPVTPKEPKTHKLTPEETAKSISNGKDVAKFLIGATDDTEERLVTDIINKEVNSDNVIKFLSGYEKNSSGGNHFFEQLRSEWDFDRKQELLHKVATDLKDYISNKYGVDSSNAVKIAGILTEQVINKSDADKLDNIANVEIWKDDRH